MSGIRLLLAFLWAGCGARSGLLDPRRDAGGDRDAREPAVDAADDASPTQDAAPRACEIVVEADHPEPVVMLLVDQSASMNDLFERESRWVALQRTLLDEWSGLVSELQWQVRFGLALYSARSRDENAGGPPIGECPLLTSVAPALGNYEEIRAVYEPAVPIEDTPTGDAVLAVIESVGAPGPDDDPVLFLLATDGEPDTCAELDPQNGQEESVAAVEQAFEAGIRTYVIAVGVGSVPAEHVQDVANAGIGVGEGGPAAEWWEVAEDSGLRDALRGIVNRVLSCELDLGARIDAERACEGTLSMDGRELACGDPDGWRAVGPSRLQLSGEACAALERNPGAILRATFPCDVLEGA